MAIAKKYNSRLVKLANPAGDVHVATFVSRDKGYNYTCGQFLHLALDPYDPSEPWPDSRCFSIVSPPEEKELTIIFSPKGKFTNKMAKGLNEGGDYFLKLPYGSLFEGIPSYDNCVFIAGGTGVAPYLSLFNSTGEFPKYTNPHLYLGVRSPEYNIYDSYLERAERINRGLKRTIVNERESGYLDIAMLLKRHGETTYFISGPPLMIKNFKGFLLEKGVDGRFVRTDEWE